MKTYRTVISLFLIVIVLISCAGCSASESGKKDEEPAGVALNIGFLKGPTGMGSCYMMDKAEKGEYTADYSFTVESDPAAINSALIAGSLDIAAVPTNAASVLYNKTEGNIALAAINTLGVLYILENGNSISSVADLDGKTIYATGQAANPEYVLNHILTENGLTPGEDVTIEWLPSDQLTAEMASGLHEICMLPVPAATGVLIKNAEVRAALDLTKEWDAVSDDGSTLTQGCIVYRTDKVDSTALDAFLKDYQASIEFMNNEDNIDKAAALAEKYQIVANAAVAKKAIPDCAMVFITGADTMKNYLEGYYNVLLEADPSSIGGNIPDDTFYYDFAS